LPIDNLKSVDVSDLLLHPFRNIVIGLSLIDDLLIPCGFLAMHYVRIVNDVSPALARETIEAIAVLGALHASPAVKAPSPNTQRRRVARESKLQQDSRS
jgi:hypothetical protein